MPRTWIRLWAGVLVAVVTATLVAQEPPTPLSLERAIFRAFDDEDHARAVELIESYLERRPNSSQMLYNLACALCHTGDLEEASSALYRAVEAGFADFEHMRRDPDLAPIRDGEMFRAIMEASQRLANERAESALDRWKQQYGDANYRYEIDEQRKIAYATALDDVSHAEMRTMLETQADHLINSFFGAPPSYYVLIAVPTPRDGQQLFGDDSIGGRYEHDTRRLISRDIGSSLRHEFFHAYHYGHMERLGLTSAHPLWVQEGLAALYEDYELADDGTIDYLPNQRSNVARRLAGAGRTIKWKTLFAMSVHEFMARPGKTYPQSRSIFEFLAERGKLHEWYQAYVDPSATDPTGVAAFETVFGKPIDEVETAWRIWARRQPPVDSRVLQGDASIGIESGINSSNDGILIERVLPGSAAGRGLLRKGDVIVAVDGKSTRSMMELLKIIGGKKVGDRVTVRVRRRGEYFARELILRPLRG